MAVAEELAAEVDAFLRVTLPPEWVAAIDAGDLDALSRIRREADADEIWRQVAAQGYVVPTWPEEYGGLGLEPKQGAAIAKGLGRFRLPRFNNPVGVDLVGPAILAWGTDEQKERFLPRIARYEDIWCQLFSEPGSGSDLAGLACRAVRDGDTWVVRGQKVWTSLGDIAAHGILLARTDPDAPKHRGITAFLLPMDAPGVTVRPLRQLTGDAEFCEVFLDDVEVDDALRLGPEGDGWRVAISVLMNERQSFPAGDSALPGTVTGRSVDGPHPAPRPGRRSRPAAPAGAGLHRGPAGLHDQAAGRRPAAGGAAARPGGIGLEALLQRAHPAAPGPGRRPRGPGGAGVARGRPVAAEHGVVVPPGPVEDHRRWHLGGAAQHPGRAHPRPAQGARGGPRGAVVGGAALGMTTPDDPASLLDIARRRTERDASTPFLLTLDGPDVRTLTYGEVLDRATALAGALADAGVGPGDRVGCYLSNSPSWVVASLAIWMNGAGVAAAGTLLPGAEATALFELADVRAVVALDDAPDLAWRSEVLRIDEGGIGSRGPAGTAPEPRLPDGDDEAVAIFTSGTTGQPKGITHTHADLVASARRVAAGYARTSDYRPDPAPAHLPPGTLFNPFGHLAGYSRLAFRMWIGRPLVILPRFTVAAAKAVFEQFDLDTLQLTPTMIHMLATAEEDLDLGTVKYVTSGTAPLSIATRERFETRFEIPVMQAYGMTEVGAVAQERMDDVLAGRRGPGSVGRLAAGVDVTDPTPR